MEMATVVVANQLRPRPAQAMAMVTQAPTQVESSLLGSLGAINQPPVTAPLTSVDPNMRLFGECNRRPKAFGRFVKSSFFA